MIALFLLGAWAVSPAPELARDAKNCSLVLINKPYAREIIRRCGDKSETYYRLDDPSAPLIESKTLELQGRRYLATRWQTGNSERVLIFDLSAEKSKVVSETDSDGPSSFALDGDRIKIQFSEKTDTPESRVHATKTRYWPAPTR